MEHSKKKISICIPTYNEEENVLAAYEKVTEVMHSLDNYDYEIIFEDNASTDNTQALIEEICNKDKRVKTIFNMANYGPARSNKNCQHSATGDAIITLACDLQDPPELIPEFVRVWESGKKVVFGKKISSEEKGIKFILRKVYYKIIKAFSKVEQYEQVTGFGLIDREAFEYIRKYDDLMMPYRYLIPELGFHIETIPYKQKDRLHGKSSYNISRYYDFALSSFVRTSNKPLRLMTIAGIIIAVCSFIMGIVYLVLKLLFWKDFIAGQAPVLIALFFIGAIQIFMIGFLGEYIGIIIERVTSRPMVIEKRRINFDEEV